jgi:NADH:ubiquinone oxidoreductase subunit 4 (subunit M)
VHDLSRRELAILVPLVVIMIWVGVQPAALLRRMEPSVQAVLERVQSQATAAPLGVVDAAPAASPDAVAAAGTR